MSEDTTFYVLRLAPEGDAFVAIKGEAGDEPDGWELPEATESDPRFTILAAAEDWAWEQDPPNGVVLHDEVLAYTWNEFDAALKREVEFNYVCQKCRRVTVSYSHQLDTCTAPLFSEGPDNSKTPRCGGQLHTPFVYAIDIADLLGLDPEEIPYED